MAEAVVSLVVGHLNTFVTEETQLLKGVVDQVRSVENELAFIRAFLKDADARAETDETVKLWVRQVRLVAFRIEDVLDMFRLRFSPHYHSHGFLRRAVHKAFGSVKHLKARHVIGTEIRDIKASLAEINLQREKYQFNRSPEEAGSSSESIGVWNSRQDDALYVEESELVGIENHKRELITWLVQGEERRKVFAVVGTGGVGKTTLVMKAYQCDAVINCFQCQAWIVVSQKFKIEDLLLKLIRQFHKSKKEAIPFELEALDRTQLIAKLRDYLQDQRYAVILDDVWSVELWNSLKHALLDNYRGSRIMITTRTDDVASSFVESRNEIYNLCPMLPEDSLLLFNKKAFGPYFNGQCPAELEKLSKQIVKKSGGLPLSIVVIGGLLLTKEKTVFEWNKFHDSLSSKLVQDPNLQSVMKIISLSYVDLPYYLKTCFLYLAVFPEDYRVTLQRLTQLWVSEGFVKEEKGKTLEEVAKDYIDQLISRSLMQKEVGRTIGGRVGTICMVHDLMREFILSRCLDENYCQVVCNTGTAISNENCRRLSIQNDFQPDTVMDVTNSVSLRSVFMLQLGKLPRSLTHTLLAAFVSLKVLELSNAQLEEFPNEITNMCNLRYLNLQGTLIRSIPYSVAKLQYLEFLSLSHTNVVELPPAILKLQKLRHLYSSRRNCRYSKSGVKMPEGIGCLRSLQTLSVIDANKRSIITDLGKLTQLRCLFITNLKREDGNAFCTSTAKMNRLEVLQVASVDKDEVLDLQVLSPAPPYLRELYLFGNLDKFPEWISSLSNLEIVALNWSRLSVGPMKALCSLPNLTHIYLTDAYVGEEMQFQAQGFQKLKTLRISRLHNLHSVMIEEGALPVLKELEFAVCELLDVVPASITHLTNLKSLVFIYMPKDLKSRIAPDGGEDYWKVKHIPKVQWRTRS